MVGASINPVNGASHESASFVVDAETAAIVAANEPALAVLGAPGSTALPISLDSSMPAIVRLRLLARTGQTYCAAERLVFWIAGRPTPLKCEVRALANGSSEKHCFALTVAPGEAPGVAATQAAKQAPGDSEPAQPVLPTDDSSPVVRDDQETLRIIARTIRDGMRNLAANRNSSEDSVPEPRTERASSPIPRPIPDQGEAEPILGREEIRKLAHELKTPLSAIAAASEVMRDEQLGPVGGPKYRDYASGIHTSAMHALDLISSILEGKSKIGVEDNVGLVDLNALAADTVSTMQQLARERDIDLDFDADSSAPMLKTSKIAVRQILLNLLANAIKYTPEGGVIRAATGYQRNGAVFLVVRDTGVGFNSAVGGNNDAKAAAPDSGRLNGSYGLGLPMVRQLAADIGAELDIDSAPGKGTVALIAFPVMSIAMG